LDVYRTDEEQVEALKKWWVENGKSIIAGIIIGFSAIFGWRAWQDYTIAQAEAASSEYQNMIAAVRQGETDSALNHANVIMDDYNSTGYAPFAALMLARLAVDAKEYATAEEHLHWAMEKSSNDQIRHIARLRLARLLIAQEKLDEADPLLNIDIKGKFLANYEELRGDIFLRQGMSEAARNAYKEALASSNTSEESRSILQIKLDELGHN
jgi:predicted negative regulator of RcsB-dependent stress response